MGQSQSHDGPPPPERRRLRLSSAFRPSSALFSSSTRQSAQSPSARRRSWMLPHTLTGPPPRDPEITSPHSRIDTSRRRSRLSRTFASALPDVLHRDRTASQRFTSRSTNHADWYNEYNDLGRSSRHGSNGSLLPTLPQEPSLDINFDDLSAVSEPTPATESRRPAPRSTTSMSDRASSLTAARPFRNLTASLRRRRPPPNRADESAANLARLLSMTAAATAASLMGVNSDAQVTDLRDAAGIVDDDGTFDGFLQALRAGGLQAALGRRQSATAQGEENPNPAALDFFRMFRFGSQGPARSNDSAEEGSHNQAQRNQSTTQASEQNMPAEEENGEGRMIPVLIVGIRSFNAEVDNREGNTENAMPSFLDALTNFPTTINIGLSDDAPPGSRQQRSGVRVSSRRRASMGGLNLFSGGRDSARRARHSETQRPRSEYRGSNQDTPPGPFPPPTTPSSPPISALSSGISTPNGRVSPTLNGATAQSNPRHESFAPQTNSHLEPTAEESATSSRSARRRRRSESDFTRFGPGSSRRHGTYLEPVDPPDSQADQTTTSRSWIIYILGGSYPENHPILTTPSLFTDSPSYEDLLLLSSLIGPAKPPVASTDDVASAGGLFHIQISEGGAVFLQAKSDDSASESIPLRGGDRCLVCLCDYQEGEEARQLAKCSHVFHRECIDQWLTTGRNSCPLCRGQGVEEKSAEEAPVGEAGPPAPPAPMAA